MTVETLIKSLQRIHNNQAQVKFDVNTYLINLGLTKVGLKNNIPILAIPKGKDHIHYLPRGIKGLVMICLEAKRDRTGDRKRLRERKK